MGSAVFQSCQNLESINVPTGIDYVPYDFCEGCQKLKSVQMHDGIRIIHWDAFWDCKLLTAIDLNDQITSIENTAFRGCESLASFSTTSQTVALPSALTFIGHNAFLNAKALTGTINVPEGVTEIEYNAFDGTAITAATLPDGLAKLGTGIFANTPNLASVTLPATITRIPNYMFQRATALKGITMPETVREIGYCAFEYSGLESIELPDSLKLIETYAFGSSQLRTIRIPDDTKTVQWGFAQSSKHLKSAYLGRNMNYDLVTDFNYFNECDSLEFIRIFAGTPPGISEWYTRNYRTNCVLEVPEDQVDLYKETDIWKTFKEIRGFFMGDVLDDFDYAVLCKLYREADGKHWKNTAWDMTNNHHAAGKWPGVTTDHTGNSKTYFITAISLPEKGLSGNLPDSLFLLPRLQALDLSSNALRGDIGAVRVREDSPLAEVNLKGNRLSGDLYPFAAQLPSVTKLDVSYNLLTDISQPLPNDKLTDLNTNMQFVDPVTYEVRADDGSPAVITNLTPGIPTDIPLPTIMTYNHSAQDYSRVPTDLARIYKRGDSFTYDWELRKNGDGLWDLYNDNTNYVLRAPKGEVLVYTNHASWSEYHTVLVRFDWQDGDVNADQTVDVSDLQSVIYYALRDRKPESQMFNFTTADVNSDQAINVSDVIGSVDYVLGVRLFLASTAMPSPSLLPPRWQPCNFPIGVKDNMDNDGDRLVHITASVYISDCSCTVVGKKQASVTDSLLITDNDGSTLSMTTSRVTFPSEITIPAGQKSVTFEFSVPANDTEEGDRTVSLTARATGFNTGSCWMLITDRNLPDGIISSLSLSKEQASPGDAVQATIVVENQGMGTLPTGTIVRLTFGNDTWLDYTLPEATPRGEKRTFDIQLKAPVWTNCCAHLRLMRGTRFVCPSPSTMPGRCSGHRHRWPA